MQQLLVATLRIKDDKVTTSISWPACARVLCFTLLKKQSICSKSHFFLLFLMFLKMVMCVICHWFSIRNGWLVLFTEQTKNLETVTRLRHQHIHIHVYRYVHQLMVVFCNRLKFGSTTALDFYTGQNKGRYCKKRAIIATRLIAGNHIFWNHNFILAQICTANVYRGLRGVCRFSL